MGYLRFETPVAVDTSFDGTIADTRKPEVLNLNRVIETYAWRRYMKSLGYPRKLGKRRKRHCFRFNWDDLRFNHSTTLSTRQDGDESVLSPITKHSHEQSSDENRHSYLSLDIQAPQVINSVQFENTSSEDTKFLFQTDTETKARITVEFQEQYTLGNKSNIEVNIPARFLSPVDHKDRTLLASQLHSQRFKETVTWAIDAEVPVLRGQRVTALLSAQGQQTQTDVEVVSSLTLVNQWLPVHIHRKSDNAVVFTCFVTDLHQVFRRYQGDRVCLTPTSSDGYHVTKQVSIISRGQCAQFNFDLCAREVLWMANILENLTIPFHFRLEALPVNSTGMKSTIFVIRVSCTER